MTSNYLVWNDLIGQHFFRPEMAGSRVYLYVTYDLISQLGQPMDNGLAEFVESVQVGPEWSGHGGVCQRAYQSFRGWRGRNLEYPPYLGYLALFTLAVSVDGDFAPHAYYPRLRTLLGEPPMAGYFPWFDRMLELWDDLERWTNADQLGRLGSFVASIAGSRIHVGLPIAQTLLTDQERGSLPSIFASAAFDPALPPRDRRLADLVARFGRPQLRPRTLRTLTESNYEGDSYTALVGVLLDELQGWDGTVLVGRGLDSRATRRHGVLRLACKLDLVAREARFGLRCRTADSFPDKGFVLTASTRGDSYLCEASVSTWSSLLVDQHGTEVDAADFNWRADLVLEDRSDGWRFSMPASEVRILVSGLQEGLPGLIEVDRLPISGSFYLVTRRTHEAVVEEWGKASCDGFTRLDVVRGLTADWIMYSIGTARNDLLIGQLFPALRLPSTPRLFLRGGLRVSKGNQFYRFAPPRLELDGSEGSLDLTVENRKTELGASPGLYDLPAGLPANTQLLVEASQADQVVGRLSIYLVGDIPWPRANIAYRADRYGQALTEPGEDLPFVAGALVERFKSAPFDYEAAFQWSKFDDKMVVYVGSVPGQVLVWPHETVSGDWKPVWAIRRRRRRLIVDFCGVDLADAEPQVRTMNRQRNIRRWKGILRYAGRRAVPPMQPTVAALWRRYLEVARRA